MGFDDYGGREQEHFAVTCYDPAEEVIKKWCLVDVENLRFMPVDPLSGMKVVWQEP